MQAIGILRSARLAGLLFALLPVVACAEDARDAVAYPRAQAAIHAQELAAAIESGLGPLAPAAPALFGAGGEIAFQRLLADIFRALDAYALAQTHLDRAYEIAMSHDDVESAANVLIALGEVALLTGNYDRVAKNADELSRLADRNELPWAQAVVEEYLGVIDRRRGKLDDAQAHATRALELQRSVGNRAGVATALSNLGTLARDRGDYATALDLFLQSLAERESTDTQSELSLRNLALIYRDLGDDPAARGYFARALKVAAEHADSANYAATLGTWAGYLVDAGEYKPALAAAEESLAVSRAIGDRPSIGYDLLDSGRALLGLDRLDEADAHLNDALAMGRELSQHEILAHSLVALAESALKRKDTVQAQKLLQTALADPQAARYKPLMVEIDDLREQIASATAKPALALQYAHESAALREDLLGTRASRRLSALESQYTRTAADQQLNLAKKENQLQSARLEQQRLQRNYIVVAACGLVAVLALLGWRFAGVRRLNGALALRNAEIETQRAALSHANERLQQQADELYQSAISDPLTGVSNRGHLMRQLDARVADCVREGRSLGLMLIDFDHFKQINDTHGHLFGDRVLVAGVQTLRQWLEPGDLIGRYGGEEFIIAVTGRDPNGVHRLADSLRAHVAEALNGFLPGEADAATVSIGIAMLAQAPTPVRLEALIERADKAVYAAKHAGRNRVNVFGDESPVLSQSGLPQPG